MSAINCVNVTTKNLIIKYGSAKCDDTYKCDTTTKKCVQTTDPSDKTKVECEATCGKPGWPPVAPIPTGLNIIGYSCGSACGAWGLKTDQDSVNLLYGVGEIIVPWVTTLIQGNTCSSTGVLNEPKAMTDFLTSIDKCIKSPEWKGEKYISIGGWSQGYTFSQKDSKPLPANVISVTDPDGPIKTIVPCFNSGSGICSDHPSSKILGKDANGNSQNWGYWCFTQDKSSINVGAPGVTQKGIGCDSGTLKATPDNCWTSVGSDQINKFIDYAQTNNYNGIDIDYESGGEVGNQPYNGYYMYLISKRASVASLKVVHAPLNNFFFNNKNWDCVSYTDSEYTDTMTKKSATSPAGYVCEDPGGYGHLLFTLHNQGIFLQNIFIQFYNNPPGPCDATVNAKSYCVTSGTIGSIGETPGVYYTMGNDPNLDSATAPNKDVGSGCSGGAGYVKEGEETLLLQCNYDDEMDKWAWKQDGFTYGGENNKKMTGQFAGDPLGYYVKSENPWLVTSRAKDTSWQVQSTNQNDPTSTDKSMQLGGIKNTLYVMLLAKSYQPNSPISFGTVPPRGGNASNLSTNMIKDIFMHLMGLQVAIDADVDKGKQSPILKDLMMDLYNNGRLRMPDMNDAYWTKYWGGPPTNDSTFCTKYPNHAIGMKNSDKLFGGIGAWSIYWTELAKSGDTTGPSWLETLKDMFHIKEMPATVPTDCKYVPSDIPSGGGGVDCHTCMSGNTIKAYCCNGNPTPNNPLIPNSTCCCNWGLKWDATANTCK